MKVSASMMRAHPSRGFTLLELMVGITVLGVLLGIAVPSFREMIRNNRTTEQTNSVVAALTYARSEAATRGLPVSVCAANATQSACLPANTGNWANGLIIFTDRTGTTGSLDADDELLQAVTAPAGGISVTTNAVGAVRFSAAGTRLNAADIVFSIKHSACSGQNRRTLTIVASGTANLRKVTCS